MLHGTAAERRGGCGPQRFMSAAAGDTEDVEAALDRMSPRQRRPQGREGPHLAARGRFHGAAGGREAAPRCESNPHASGPVSVAHGAYELSHACVERLA